MKDPMQVLRMKELELLKVRKEIDALHIVARLLSEEKLSQEKRSEEKTIATTAESKITESKTIEAKLVETDAMEPIIMESQPIFRQLIEMP